MSKLAIGVSLFTAGVCLGVIGYAQMQPRLPETRQVALREQDIDKLLEKKLAAVNARLDQLSRRLANMSAPGEWRSQPSVAAAQTESSGADRETPEQRDTADIEYEEQAREDERIRRTAAESRYQNEVRDAAWAAAQESAIYRVLIENDALQGIDIDQLDCRSTTCLLEIHMSDTAQPYADAVLVGELGRELPNATWTRQGRLMTLFLSRSE